MTDTATPEPAADRHGRPLGGQLERDGRLLAAAQGIDLTDGSVDNATRAYWYRRATAVYQHLHDFGRGDDVVVSYVEPCTITCDCGERTVPWPREAITVECETCGVKHGIAPLMENHLSVIDSLNEEYAKNRQLRNQIECALGLLDDELDVDEIRAALGGAR